MRGAGCIINDLWDREIDKKVERTRMRPLAGGAISPQKAMIALAILLLAGGVILLQFNWLTIWLGVLTLPLIVLYPLMKRITYWPQAFLGIVFNFGALMGWTVFRGQIDPPALFLYAACVFWTLGYDTIYAHQDREDDVMAGVKSTALRLGAYSRPAVMGFYGLHALLLMSAIINTYQLYGGNLLFSYSFLAMILLPALTLGVMIRLQRWNTASPGDSLQLFRENGIYGAFVLILLYFAGL